jgi:hypothetical protein
MPSSRQDELVTIKQDMRNHEEPYEASKLLCQACSLEPQWEYKKPYSDGIPKVGYVSLT